MLIGALPQASTHEPATLFWWLRIGVWLLGNHRRWGWPQSLWETLEEGLGWRQEQRPVLPSRWVHPVKWLLGGQAQWELGALPWAGALEWKIGGSLGLWQFWGALRRWGQELEEPHQNRTWQF